MMPEGLPDVRCRQQNVLESVLFQLGQRKSGPAAAWTALANKKKQEECRLHAVGHLRPA